MLKNPKMRLEEIDSRLKELPKGTLTYKTINGKKQLTSSVPYRASPRVCM